MAQWSTRRFTQIGLQVKDECKTFKTFFYIFCYIFEPCIKIWWFLSTFGWILIIKNLKKHLILIFSHFYMTFWLYIISTKKYQVSLGKIWEDMGQHWKNSMKPLGCQTTSKKLWETWGNTHKTFGDVGKTLKSDKGAKKTLWTYQRMLKQWWRMWGNKKTSGDNRKGQV